jgi:hypothetical protein
MNRRVPEHGHRLYLCGVAGVAEAFEHHPTGLPAATLSILGGTLHGSSSLKTARQPGFPTKQPTKPQLAAASWKNEQVPMKNPSNIISDKLWKGFPGTLVYSSNMLLLTVLLYEVGWGGTRQQDIDTYV